MPLHRLFAPPGTFSEEDKAAIARAVTSVYTQIGLPAFYAIVLFIDVPKANYFVGGEPTHKHVRVVTQHLARDDVGPEGLAKVAQTLGAVFAPYTKDRGYGWEFHIEEHSRAGWTVNGLVPPLAGSEAEKLWAKLNKPVEFGETVATTGT